MKKITSLLIAAAVVCGTFFTSCDVDDNDFVAPKDTWVYRTSSKNNYSLKYTWKDNEGKDKTVGFDVYVNYATATENKEITFKSNVKKEIQEGLNVILIPQLDDSETKSNIKELVSTSTGIEEICFLFNFGKSLKAGTEDSTTNDKSIPLSSTLWTLIYNFNKFDKYTETQFEKFIKAYTLADTESTKNINSKKIIYNLIGEKLFAEN